MILTFSTNSEVVNGIRTACGNSGLDFQAGRTFSSDELRAMSAQMQVLVVDLTCAALSTDKVLSCLEELDQADIPPVLYLLSSPSDLEHVMSSGSIVNLDYAFLPVDPAQLSPRLEVLNTLGRRRRRSMETAISDRLTGLYNRKYFLRRLEEEMYRTTRYDNQVGVLLVDVDFDIPDGRLSESTAGDLLPQVAAFFQDRLRRSDIIARYKWSQIAIALPEISATDCEALAQDIRQKLKSAKWKSEGQHVRVQPTVAWLMFPLAEISSGIEVMTTLEDSVMAGRTGNRQVVACRQDAELAAPAS